MNQSQFETVIIGGGQAGLVTAYQFTHRGLPCVVLDENDKIGATWRKRWDSLRLFTPGRYNSLPGMPYPGNPRSYPTKDDIADYLKAYTSRFELPVKNGIKVNRLSTNGSGTYVVETSENQITCDNVVVATGAFHNPRVPEFADALDPTIFQLHSSEYRTPSQVPEGSVLVVGAGQSGAEIALDMAEGHQLWLSGRDNGEEPAGRGPFATRFIKPFMVFAAKKVINVANPIGRKMRNHFLYPPRGIPRARGTRKLLLDAGVEWVGRTTGTKDGYPIHDRGVVESQPGLYFMGLLFQRSLSSALTTGMGEDAKYIAKHIASNRTKAKK